LHFSFCILHFALILSANPPKVQETELLYRVLKEKSMNAAILSLVLLVLSGPTVETAKEPSTHLYVRTIPPGAKILLDDRPGTTDGLFSPITPGKHRVAVELDGFAPERREVDVQQGRITRVEVSLKKVEAVSSTPGAATPGARQPGAKGPAAGAAGPKQQPPAQPAAKAKGPFTPTSAIQDEADKVEDLVEKALRETEADFAFDQAPLTDVVEHLRRTMKINILLDARALEESAMDPSTTQVTIRMRVSRGSALDFMLSQLGLTWIVRDGAVVITTAQKAQEELSTKVYPIEDLSVRGDSNSLLQILTSTIAPQTWDKAGGPGSISLSPRSDRLVVRQTYQVHRQIRRLLATLRTMDADAAAGKTPEPILFYGALTAAPADVQYYRKALAQPVSEFAFDQAPLTDVAEHVAIAHKMNVVIDKKALEDAGIDASSPTATFSVRNIPLGQALSLLLERVGLTWVLEGDYLRITTKQFAEERLVVGVYPIGDLAPDLKPEKLIETITKTISPETWESAGGEGSIAPIMSPKLPVVVISQTDAVHRQIAALLAQLRAKGQAVPPKAAEGTSGRP
jgi:hypothetical protein